MSGGNFSLLNKVNDISDLKTLSRETLAVLADEIRAFVIQNISVTGGHLGSSLGVMELSVALHYVFDSPKDKIIWDVGHQSYPHKVLTGRKDQFGTIRQYKGLSGFPKMSESIHDAYGTGHASTSISAALGFAIARDLKRENHEVIAIIGDGSLTGGNALEAINHAGYLNTKLIVILNDNRMSISKNVGAISKYTHRIEKTDTYKELRTTIATLIEKNDGLREQLLKLKGQMKKVGSPGLLFEKLGFNYIGPVDGHDIGKICMALQKARERNGASLIHIQTIKGKGYLYAEQKKSKYHGVRPFNIESGDALEKSKIPSFSSIFGSTLVELAQEDEKIVGITAAMPDGTGLALFKKRFPKRFFDVGIAEQHAAVFAAGLAATGLKPVIAIYSSFLQRAYDAVIHDICLQNLPVTIAVDRAGIVGSDGPTHHGCFDLSYLRHIPNLILMAPKDEDELRHMLYTALASNRPAAIRYPRGAGFEVTMKKIQKLAIGKAEVVRKGNQITIVTIGTVFQEAVKACDILESKGVSSTLINARYVKPLDRLIGEYIKMTKKAIVIEENSVKGGFGSAVLEMCHEMNIEAQVKQIGIPDKFIEHGTQLQLRQDCGIYFENIVQVAVELIQDEIKA